VTYLTYAPLPFMWPGGKRTAYPKRSNFETAWDRTVAQLDRELTHLGVTGSVVCETGYEPWQIKSDGQLRSNIGGIHAKGDPAVVLSFQAKRGALRYWCDTYDRRVDNVRAITLSLEALRAVSRWGVLRNGEQYTGNLALPAGMGPSEASEFLRKHGDGAQDALGMYRAAAKKLHPDAGGERHEWDALQRAKEVLGL